MPSEMDASLQKSKLQRPKRCRYLCIEQREIDEQMQSAHGNYEDTDFYYFHGGGNSKYLILLRHRNMILLNPSKCDPESWDLHPRILQNFAGNFHKRFCSRSRSLREFVLKANADYRCTDELAAAYVLASVAYGWSSLVNMKLTRFIASGIVVS